MHMESTSLAKKRSESTDPIDFEAALKELEGLVEKMEQGDLSLESSLAAFERGIQLTRTCQEALTRAELKIEQLVNQGGQEQIAPFDSDDA
jgi:exodeoxyribonuclease VII small subunit